MFKQNITWKLNLFAKNVIFSNNFYVQVLNLLPHDPNFYKFIMLVNSKLPIVNKSDSEFEDSSSSDSDYNSRLDYNNKNQKIKLKKDGDKLLIKDSKKKALSFRH